MVNLIAASVFAVVASGQVVWYVWMLRTSTGVTTREPGLPLVGLLCGICVLTLATIYVVIGWTHGPAVADRFARRLPFPLIIFIYMAFTGFTISLKAGGMTDGRITSAIAREVARYPIWMLIGIVIGLISVPPVPLHALPSVANDWLLLVAATLTLSLAEAIVVLVWLVRTILRMPPGGDRLVYLVSRVPAVGWGWICGYVLTISIYYVMASLLYPA